MSATGDLNRVIKKILKDMDRNVNRQVMRQLAAEAVRMIVDRSRDGYGVKKFGGSQYKFPRLSEAYIKQRRRMRLSRFTSPGMSNVTLSGRMLASIRTFQDEQGKVSIGPSGSNRNGKSNEEVAGYLEKQGRLFLSLSADEIKKLGAYYERKLLKL